MSPKRTSCSRVKADLREARRPLAPRRLGVIEHFASWASQVVGGRVSERWLALDFVLARVSHEEPDN
jgi:hypothetical protein